MKCPKDGAILQSERLHGVKVDMCGQCKGVWFDRDELRRAKDNTDDDLRWLDFDLFSERDVQTHASDKRNCPKDKSPMLAKVYDRSKIVTDICPVCNGVWLDRKEYEKIIYYLQDRMYSETAAEYSEDLLKELLEVGTGNEGVVSEVKDFTAVLRLLESRLAVEHPMVIGLNKFLYRVLPIK